MSTTLDVVTDVRDVVDDAADLVRTAYAPPFLEMNTDFLAWALSGSFDPGRPGLAAIARDDGRLVSFVGAAARPLAIGNHAETGYVISFLATAPDHRGRGLVTSLYVKLLETIATLGAPVLTYTIAESPGDLATQAAYRQAQFTGRLLEPLIAWGAVRGRLRPATAVMLPAMPPMLSLSRSASLSRYLESDPRGTHRVHGDALVTTAWRTGTMDRTPVLIVETLPQPLDAIALRRAVDDSFTAFPDHSNQLTVPGIPERLGVVAQGAGLRRLAVAPYRPSVWAVDANHPFLQAELTTHPIL